MKSLSRLPMRLAILIMFSALIATFCLYGSYRYAMSDWVPDRKIGPLEGASREEVRELLGEPEYYSAPDKWAYTQLFRVAEFQVHFDENDRVVSWNYDR